MRQDLRTHESRGIIKADAKDITPRDNIEMNPPPFVSFEGGTRETARQPRGTPSAKQQMPLAEASLDSVKALPPSPNKIPRVPSWKYPCLTSKPAHQRVVIGTPGCWAMAEERRETKTCPPEHHLLQPSKHQPDQRSQPAPSSGSHQIQ